MSKTERAQEVDRLAVLIRKFHPMIPFNKALGIEVVELGDGYSVQRLPYSTDIVGDPETGVIHGGAISSLLDSACGAAGFMTLSEPDHLATLDLRIDYLRPATPGLAVLGRAECYRRTRQVAFLRCVAYHPASKDGAGGPDDPIATGSAAFVMGTPSNLKAPRSTS